MKVAISYPPLESNKGVPLLSQNRQFQWFKNPTYIYPVIPAQAATLLKENGYEVIWDDGIAEEKSYQRWRDDLLRAEPDVVAMETKTPVVRQHWQIIDELKALRSQTMVVLMGDHVTALPEESMRECPVDFVITGGDYDFSLLALCEYLDAGCKMQDAGDEWREAGGGRQETRDKGLRTKDLGPRTKLPSGVWYRADGEIRDTGPFRLDGDLNKLPFIDRELTKWWLYAERNGNFKRTPGTYIMAGRDCWHHRCTFCSWTTIFPRYRTRSPENVLDEIGKLIERYGMREIMDDTGTFPKGAWLREFCRGMIERGHNKKVTLDCNMRFGALSGEDYALMKEAGFRLLLFGLESANQGTLDRINKALTVEEIVESCQMARAAGLYPHVTIMFGYPWESYEEALNTLRLGRYLLKKGYAYTVQATVVIPYPGTPLFEECRTSSGLKTLDWDRYDMKEPVMVTPMGDEQVMELVQAIYGVAFDPEFMWRKLLSVRDMDDVVYFWRAGMKVLGHLVDFGGWQDGRWRMGGRRRAVSRRPASNRKEEVIQQ
jgi:radical SAM superfamily enzyme YgiQ (UPF0313 family)